MIEIPWKKKTSILAVCIALFFLGACSTRYFEPGSAKGVYHKVNKGETLWRIAQAYKIDIQDLAEVNNITDPTVVVVGDVIFIPEAKGIITVEPAPSTAPLASKEPEPVVKPPPPPTKPEPSVKITPPEKEKPIKIDRTRFIWPVHGPVSSHFGIQKNGMRFNGITIDAKEGIPVVAASGGKVIHSSPLKYYGETVIIKHGNNYTSVYAYLKKRHVQVGDTISKGDTIAVLGKNKKKKKSCLHFEIRQNNKPKNPLFYLPKGGNSGITKAKAQNK